MTTFNMFQVHCSRQTPSGFKPLWQEIHVRKTRIFWRGVAEGSGESVWVNSLLIITGQFSVIFQNQQVLPVVPCKAVAEASKIGNL